jgi:predicted short-subunit dehydrogenase-like oxidoreductase (DUF2520 family)
MIDPEVVTHTGADLQAPLKHAFADRYLMRELERDLLPQPHACGPDHGALAIVGRGRLGTALARALREAGWSVTGPLGRGAAPQGAQAVLLCVPDSEIESAAALLDLSQPVGHCSGASTLDVLAPHEAFSIHPLMTVTSEGAEFRGAGAAIAGSTPRALALAASIAATLGLRAVEVAEHDRAAYHAAASIASNFLVTLEAAAERLALSAGVDRELLAPLVHATVQNWASLGARRALTGPVARGDEQTTAGQRQAVAERAPELLALFDALVACTRALASRDPGSLNDPDPSPRHDAPQEELMSA